MLCRAVPQTLLQDKLLPWFKQSSCSGPQWLQPVPEPILLGINQPNLQHREPFQACFPALPARCFGNIKLLRSSSSDRIEARGLERDAGGERKGLLGLGEPKYQAEHRYWIGVVVQVLLSIPG